MVEPDEDINIPDTLDEIMTRPGRRVAVHFTDGKKAVFDDIARMGSTPEGALVLADDHDDLRAFVHPEEWKFAEFLID